MHKYKFMSLIKIKEKNKNNPSAEINVTQIAKVLKFQVLAIRLIFQTNARSFIMLLFYQLLFLLSFFFLGTVCFFIYFSSLFRKTQLITSILFQFYQKINQIKLIFFLIIKYKIVIL